MEKVVSKELFLAYENVRSNGQFNMVMDAAEVMEVIGATEDEYIYILNHYSELADEYLK